MLQELFRIPFLNLPVYGYGLMLVLGFWASIELARFLANKHGLKGDDFAAMGLLALASGVVGARLSHVLENLSAFTSAERSAWENFRAAINLSEGGLTFYGGFILATVALLVYGKLRQIPVRRAMDIIAPCIMLGLAFGRIGCLLNGCCWGQTCDPNQVAWAITFPYGSPPFQTQFKEGTIKLGTEPDDVPYSLYDDLLHVHEDGTVTPPGLRSKDEVAKSPELAALARQARSAPVHPAQVYSTLNALLIAGVCLVFLSLRPRDGRVFAAMLLLYGPSRFVLETLRVEPAVELGLSFSMWTSIGVTIVGAILWIIFGLMKPRPSDAGT